MNQEKQLNNTSPTKWDYTLMAPGPVNIHPEVRRILSQPMIHHRTPEFDKILSRVLSSIKMIFQTTESVYLMSCTGSGGMEALIVNTLSPKENVLAIVSGKFGERWSEMATIFGCSVEQIIVPWGEVVNPDEVKEKLQLKKYAAVLCQACETSTGVLHPIKKLGQIISEFPDTLFLVDGITALGAVDLPMDSWNIDGLVGGSQKAFMLPTGMSFISFSKKAQLRFETSSIPKFYFDIRKEKAANKKGETFFSSNVALIKALDYLLEHVIKNDLNILLKANKHRSQFTALMMQLLELTSFAKIKSDSLTAIMLPNQIDGQVLREKLETDFNITVMGGQDKAKGKIIRIGHMGYIQDKDLMQLAYALFKTLDQMGYKPKIECADYESQLKKFLEINHE